jgi:hypothetical protein
MPQKTRKDVFGNTHSRSDYGSLLCNQQRMRLCAESRYRIGCERKKSGSRSDEADGNRFGSFLWGVIVL